MDRTGQRQQSWLWNSRIKITLQNTNILMEKYLYGASVQGIQSFIFETNKLKEIVGASEIVEEICTSHFTEQLKINHLSFKSEKLIVGAAGNIKYQFDESDKIESIKSFVKTFPKTRVLFTEIF